MAETILAAPGRLARARRLTADICQVVLSATLWMAGTTLVALGALLMFLILAADARPSLFFAHLQNLANHYLAADAVARVRFDRQLLGLFAGLVGLLLIARLPSFIRRLREELSRGGPHA